MKKEYDLEQLQQREEELFRQFLQKSYGNSSENIFEEKSSQQAEKCPATETDDDDALITSLADLVPDMSAARDIPQTSATDRIKAFLRVISSKENTRKLTCLAVPGVLVLFLVLNILTPSAKISEKENRTLAGFPKISLGSIMSGKFMSDFESYISDQFVFRNSFVAAKRRYEVLSGKEANHNILICDDGYLIENTSELTEDNILPNIKAVNALAEVGRYNVTLAVVPTAYEIMKDKLPAFAYVNSYDKLQSTLKKEAKNVTVADTKKQLEEYSDKYLYYRSDHHQTALGSYVTYAALGQYMGYEPYAADDFAVESMADDFCGTAWSNSGFASTKNDTIYKYSLTDEPKCSVNFAADGTQAESIYNKERLKQKDKYAYYLDGNHAIAQIKSDCGTGKKCAVIKDSYAHSMVPFLVNHYSEIYMIDLRYYNGDIFEYLYNHNIKDILVLYNQNTFMTDTNLGKITEFAKTSVFTSVPDVSYGIVPQLEAVEAAYFDDAAFVGDSLTIGIQNFSGFNADFLCMGGLNTKNLDSAALPNGKSVMQSIKDKEHLGKLYIMLGTNEVAFNEMDSFIERYSQFIDNVREKFPNVIIYIESIMPVTKETSETTGIKNDRITVYNEALLKLAKEKQCYYVDVHSYFEGEDGYLPDNIGSDGIHLGPVKYREMAAYLQSHAVPEKGVVKIGKSGKKTFKGGGNADTSKIGEEILDTVEFKDSLLKVADSLVISSYKVDSSKVCSAALYLGGGATAEEVAVFEMTSEKEAKKVETLAKERIERRKKDFENYIPAEMTKLNSPVIVRKGKLVAVCVADKVSKDEIAKLLK